MIYSELKFHTGLKVSNETGTRVFMKHRSLGAHCKKEFVVLTTECREAEETVVMKGHCGL